MGYTYEELMQKGATPGTPSSAPSGSPKKKYTYEELVSQGATPSAAPVAPQPEKKDGFLKSMVKDAAETLLVKPADRVAELIGRSGILGENIKTGYEVMADEGTNRRIFGIDIDQQRGFNNGGLKQIGGEALKTASYLYSGGAAAPVVTSAVRATVPGASRAIFSQGVRESAKQGAKVGTIGGGAYGAGDEMTQEDSTLGSIVGAGAVGAGLGAVTGGAFGTAVPYATKLLNPAERAARRASEVKDAMNRVVLSRKGDVAKDSEKTTRALRELDIEGVETNADLVTRIDEKIKDVVDNLDEVLETDTTRRTLGQLSHRTDVNGQTVKANFVDDALTQLEKEYVKTNNVRGAAQVRQLREKAQRDGLTVKEVNDIARTHAKDLSAYNLNGELSSGLAKQAAENTRRGLKDTARTNFGNKISEEADRVISDLSRLKKIASDRAKAVEKIKTQTLSPTFMQRAGGLLEQAINIATLGSSRALVSVALQGAKNAANKAGTRMNALDLEKKLVQDLKLIQEAAKKGVSEETIIKKLQQFIKSNGEKPVLLLEAPKPKPLFATPGGKITPVAQEAADVAAVEAGKAVPPALPRGRRYNEKVQEAQENLGPYLRPDEMPVIRAGRVPKKPRSLNDIYID